MLRFTHCSTERLDICIVTGSVLATKDISKNIIPRYLETDVFSDHGYNWESNEKVLRILKYYGDCPCWNLVSKLRGSEKGVVPCLEVHIHFRDIKASFMQEREDIKKMKEKERRQRRKERANEK